MRGKLGGGEESWGRWFEASSFWLVGASPVAGVFFSEPWGEAGFTC